MLNLKEYIGDKYKVTINRDGGDLDDEHYMIVQGKRGDIMAFDDDTLQITVYGRPLKIASEDKTHNMSLPMKCEKLGWKIKNSYDDSICFLIKKDAIYQAINAIKPRKKRLVTEEMRERGRQLAALAKDTKAL